MNKYLFLFSEYSEEQGKWSVYVYKVRSYPGLKTLPGGLDVSVPPARPLLSTPCVACVLGQEAAHRCMMDPHSEDGRISILELPKTGLCQFSN